MDNFGTKSPKIANRSDARLDSMTKECKRLYPLKFLDDADAWQFWGK